MRRFFCLVKLSLRIVGIRLFQRAGSEAKIRREIYISFKELGGVYVKFLQNMILNANFLKGWGGPAELDVFESLDYEPINPKQILINELGEASDRFKSVNGVPFATGSFAQVYEAHLTDDTHVIVKILRPRLIKTLKSDLRSLGILLRLISLFKASSLFDSRALFKNFAEMTLSEVKYDDEVKKAKWFWKYYQHHPHIVVPWTYQELSSSSVLTQDFVPGISLAELMAKSEEGFDPVQICQVYLGSDFWQQLELLGNDLVHVTLWSDYMFGDPHPGNIKFLPGNKIGLIDFGLVVETAPNKRAYLELLESYKSMYDDKFEPGRFMVAAISFFDESLAKSLRRIEKYKSKQPGFMLGKVSQSAAMNFFSHIQQGLGNEAIDRKRIIQVFTSAINDDNRYGLRMNPQSAGMIKSARAYILMLRKFSANNREQEIMARILGEQIEYAKANIDNLPDMSDIEPVSLESAIEILTDWLTQLADKDPGLYGSLNGRIKPGAYA